MSMLLLLPIGLAALASLLLPLLVHLARRSEQRVVPFAALRWLKALPQPRRKHRFEELLLMLVRLLLLAALAVLLAQPVLFGRPDRRPRVAVAPGVDIATARAQPIEDHARWLWLAPGFPELDLDKPAKSRDDASAATSAGEPAPFASLLRELDAQLPAGTPLTVIVPTVLDGADAQRPVLSRRVDWRIVPAAAGSAAEPVSAVRWTAFALQVRHAPDRIASLRYLRAAGVALTRADQPAAARAPRPDAAMSIAPADQPPDAGARALVWLVPGPAPAVIRDWVASGGQLLLDPDAQWPDFPRDAPIVWRDDQGALARAIGFGKGRVLKLDRPLLPAAMPGLLDAGFPLQLRDLFAQAPAQPSRVEAAGYAPRTGAAAWPERPRPLAPWLVWLVASLFLLERLLASGRRRSEAA
jgi:hypothetical protein